jgi:hypothetical protein
MDRPRIIEMVQLSLVRTFHPKQTLLKEMFSSGIKLISNNPMGNDRPQKAGIMICLSKGRFIHFLKLVYHC